MTQQAQEQKKRDIPLWLGIALVVLGVGIASWFVWSQVSNFWTGPSGVFTIQGVDPAVARSQAGPRRRQPQPPPARQLYVRQINDTHWRARIGMFSLTAEKQAEALKISILAGTAQIMPKDQPWVFAARSRLTTQAIKDIGLTDQQVKQFKVLPTAVMINLNATPDQLKPLTDLFTKYIAVPAAERDPVDRLIATELDKTGKSLLPATKTALQQQYDAFRKTVTDAQWEKLKALGTLPVPAPAEAPAAAPARAPATTAAAAPAATPAPALTAAPTTTRAKP